MKIISSLIIITGISLLGYSFTFDRYTNEQEYNEQYLSLTGPSDSEKFYEIRDKYLTPKFKLQDYGLTFIFSGLILLFLSFNKGKTPSRKIIIILIGFAAALLSNIAYVGDLFLEMYRESYPHWADSLGIPLMGVPGLLILSFIWVGLNLIGMSEPFKTRVQMIPLKKDNLNKWYVSILLLTILLTFILIIDGYFWQVIPGFLWAYFYSSILFGKREAMIEKIKN
jgi:hypothetical protein